MDGRLFPVMEVFLPKILKITNFRVTGAFKPELNVDPAYQGRYSKKEIR